MNSACTDVRNHGANCPLDKRKDNWEGIVVTDQRNIQICTWKYKTYNYCRVFTIYKKSGVSCIIVIFIILYYTIINVYDNEIGLNKFAKVGGSKTMLFYFTLR